MSTADQPSSQPPAKKKGWFGRNWLWFVPTIVLLPILACGGCIGGSFFLGVRAMKGEPYQQALSYVQNSDAVTDRLGEPVEEASFVPSGNVDYSSGGEADQRFDISGPNGKANVHLRSRNVGGQWDMVVLEVTFDNGERINLLQFQDKDALDGAPPFNPNGPSPDDQDATDNADGS